MVKRKQVLYTVKYKNRNEDILACTPEGAVKKFFKHEQLPRVIDGGGFKGVDVKLKNGYVKITKI